MKENIRYPFVTIVQFNGDIYYGIIKIMSKQFLTIYCLNKMTDDDINEILELSDDWWWKSNRIIPICLYMVDEMDKFEKYTVRFNTDQAKIISGPTVSLSNIATKRIKRRNTILKKRPT